MNDITDNAEVILTALALVLEDNKGTINITPRAINDFTNRGNKFHVAIKHEEDDSITLTLHEEPNL